MENLFQSPRLSYRAIEDTPFDENFIHRIQADIVSFAASDSSLLKPQTHAASKSHKTYLQTQTLLAVIICLGPPNPKNTPEPIGCISLTAPKEHHRNSYISIDIIRPYQGKGYGSEAIEWVLDWGFRIAGLHRIGIEAFEWNAGARKLYERLGFVFEGMKRDCYWYDGGWWGYLSFSMLEQEWKERKRLLEEKKKKKEKNES